MVAIDGAQQEGAELASAAKLQELARVGQRADRALHLAEPAVEPGLQLREGNVRHVPVVENRKRQAELGAKLFQAHLRPLGLSEDVVGRLPDGGQVIHERARPVEDNVPNHGPSVVAFLIPAIPASQRQRGFVPPVRLRASDGSLRTAASLRLSFVGLSLEFVAQFPPELPRFFRPQQYPETRLVGLGPGPQFVFNSPEPGEPLKKLLAEGRLDPGVVFPFRRRLAGNKPLPALPLAQGAPRLLSLAHLNATPHKIAPFRRQRQMLAPRSGGGPAKRAMLLINHV